MPDGQHVTLAFPVTTNPDARVIRQRRQRRRRAIGLTITVVSLAALIAVAPRALRKKPLLIKSQKVERSLVRDVVASSTAGEVVPARKATVRAELGARVVAVKHERGDRVKRGEAVLLLDAADLEARVAQASATVAANAAQVAQAQARVAAARRSAERAKSLAARGAGTAQLSEDSEAMLKEAEEAARAADGMRAQAEAALRVARVSRGKAEIAAPFDGVLVEMKLDPGEELSPGAPVFEIIDDTKLYVEASIDEADVARIKTGQPATLTLDALPGRTIEAVVSRLGPAVRKDLKGARTLPIDVDVKDPQAALAVGLKSGMSADVEIIVAEKPDVLSLPTNVIIGRGAKRNVYKIVEGHAKLTPVEVGLSNWDRTELLSGVALGDEVVATLNMKELEDGVAVKPGKP
jgi:HlyD family secretion protein